ncbi:MAG: 16S rRNA processing protein RimM [Oscillospiraceae bacterium]|nr:16S rRNA processing protein RimM [Oscillospiraceae bacterium]
MSRKPLLEAGRIVNTHGIQGEVKIQSFCDSAAFLQQFDAFYIDHTPVPVVSSRVHKNCLLARLAGVETVDDAARMRGKTIYVDRSNIQLPEGQYFIADLVGLTVYDAETGESIGKLVEVFPLPAGDVYSVKGERSYLIPARGGFVETVDLEQGRMTVHLIEGLAVDE